MRPYNNLRDNWTQRNKPSKGAMYRERIDIDHATYSAVEAGYYTWAKSWIEHFMTTDHPGIVNIPTLPTPPGPGVPPAHLPAPPAHPAPPAPVNPMPTMPAAALPPIAPAPPTGLLPGFGIMVALPVSGPYASVSTTVPAAPASAPDAVLPAATPPGQVAQTATSNNSNNAAVAEADTEVLISKV